MATQEKQKRKSTARVSKNASEELKELIAAARKLNYEEQQDLQKAIQRMLTQGVEQRKKKLIEELKTMGVDVSSLK